MYVYIPHLSSIHDSEEHAIRNTGPGERWMLKWLEIIFDPGGLVGQFFLYFLMAVV